MATYAIQTPPHAGAQITYTAPPASGDVAPTGSGIGLLVRSPSATITVSLPMLSFDGVTVGPRVVTVTSGQDWLIPLPSSVYGSPSVILTYSGTLTSVQVAVITTPGT
jgi:hypothetical protein